MTLPLFRTARPYIAGVILALAGMVAVSALAHSGPPSRGGPGPMAMMSPEHVERRVDRMLERVNATAEQRTQIQAIVRSALGDLKETGATARTLRERSIALFAQPTVDEAAVEAARQDMLKQRDAASRRITQAVVEASRVLTPEQRKKLVDEIDKRDERMQRSPDDRPRHEPRR